MGLENEPQTLHKAGEGTGRGEAASSVEKEKRCSGQYIAYLVGVVIAEIAIGRHMSIASWASSRVQSPS